MNQSLIRYILQLADNSLILGHRLSEWCGHAPILEVDIALSNIAGKNLLSSLRISVANGTSIIGKTANVVFYPKEATDNFGVTPIPLEAVRIIAENE